MDEKKVNITLDTTIENVLELDDDGYELYFDDESFLDLGKSFEKLSHDNKIRYAVVKKAFLDNEKQKDEMPSKISISPRMALASARLEITNGSSKFHRCWKRPDQLQSCINMGYTQCIEGKDGISFGGEKGRSITLGKAGFEELVLMQIPIELYKEMQKAIEDRSRFLDGTVQSTAEAQLEEAGGKPFTDDEKRKDLDFTSCLTHD